MSTNRIIVFGGGTVLDESGHAQLHPASVERAERAINYYNDNKELFIKGSLGDDAFILCTGGYGLLSAGVEKPKESDREAVLTADYLISKGGIPKEVILLEKESTSTLTNWTRSLEIYSDILSANLFDETNRLGLISHPYHLMRVVYLAEKLGYTRGIIEEIPTIQIDNQSYENQVLAVYKRYLTDTHTPLEMEEKERDLAGNVELTTYLRSQQ